MANKVGVDITASLVWTNSLKARPSARMEPVIQPSPFGGKDARVGGFPLGGGAHRALLQ